MTALRPVAVWSMAFAKPKFPLSTGIAKNSILSGFQSVGHLEKCPDEPEPGQRTSPGLGILAFGRS